ncbi:MAG: hypothetical protein M1835_007857 [Candelina submexicana]|nr:MAG: hypothetical protein M1835_007857 [Candelina submexicana]
MFSTLSNPFKIPKSFTGWKSGGTQKVNIAPVEIHDVATSPERRARALKHLIRLNHASHAIIYHDLQFHNHCPHWQTDSLLNPNTKILGSAYLLGASSDQLHEIYDREDQELEPWHDAPGEISKDDWRDFLGDARYQRAFLDFFEDELVLKGYDWRKVVAEFLFEGKEPLINNVSVGHPLIHLGYAFELANREVAMEALAMTASSHNFLHKYLDDPSYTKPSTYSSDSPLEMLKRVYDDRRFNGLFGDHGAGNIKPLFDHHEAAVLEHWNAWKIEDPTKQFEQSQQAAVAILVATHGACSGKYDFFLVHLLTTSHAVRILLPLIPEKFHVPVVRQWWLLTLAVYIAQLRPSINLKSIEEFELGGKDWKWVEKQAIDGKFATDAHYVKGGLTPLCLTHSNQIAWEYKLSFLKCSLGIRAMKVAAETWGDPEDWYLKAAARFAGEFDGWGGFGG